MPDRSPVTFDSLQRAVDALAAQRLAQVTYLGTGLEPDDWDFGRYHLATMGVELVTQDGTRFLATWGDAFGRFGLELLVVDADQAVPEGERRPFSDHAWWQPFIRARMGVSLIWRTGHLDSDQPCPVALALTDDAHTLWVAVAEESTPGGRILVGMDQVLVTGDRGFAAELGLLT